MELKTLTQIVRILPVLFTQCNNKTDINIPYFISVYKFVVILTLYYINSNKEGSCH